MSLESIFKLSLIMNMVDNLSGPMARVNSSVGGSVTKLQKVQSTLGATAKSGAIMAGIGSQITEAALAPVKATFETKQALGELKSVGVKDLQALETASANFSNQWAGTTKAEFINSAYDIKSGIASLSDEAVAKYTEIAGMTAKGTRASISQMTSLFATGYGIYKGYYSKMSDIKFGEMFAAGIAHTANIYKTDGPGMAEAISSLGAAATSAKVPMEEQFAILGQLQATMSGSEAGTKYRAVLQTAAQAGKELGLNFTDANHKLLTMPEILTKLKGKFGETMDAAEKMQLQKAFGQEDAVAMIDLLYNKTGDLTNGMNSIKDSMGKGVSEVKNMADAINNTEPGKYEVLQQKVHNTAEKLGNNLLPQINTFLTKADDLVTKTSAWISKHQELAKVITMVVLAFGVFLTVGGSTITVISGVGLVVTKGIGYFNGFTKAMKAIPGLLETVQIKALYAGDALKKGFSGIQTFAGSAATGIKNVVLQVASFAKTAAISAASAIKSFITGLIGMARQAITTAITALPGLIASVWAFTAALLANPITWIVIGIIALIAAVYLLWKHWDTVTAFLKKAWSGFVKGIKVGFDWVKNLFGGMPKWLKIVLIVFLPFIGIPLLVIKHFKQIIGFFKNLWAGIHSGASSGVDKVKSIWTGFLEHLRAGIDWVKNLFGGMKKWIDIAVAVFLPFIGIPMLVIKHWKEIMAFFKNLWFTIKTGFVNGINSVKTFFNGLPAWFKRSGAKIIDTLVDGIKSSAMKPVTAIKNIFKKVRNLLPFSDAKEGPLSTLTLSGHRTMSTLATGIQTAEKLPYKAVEKSLNMVNWQIEDSNDDKKTVSPREPVKKVSLKEIYLAEKSTEKSSKEKDTGTKIDRLILNIDINKIKELMQLFKLVDEIEDFTNSNALITQGEG